LTFRFRFGESRNTPSKGGRMLRHRWATLVGWVVVAAVLTPAAVADPDPENNKNAVSRTLQCDNGQTLAATFAGGGSNFNVTIDERVFVYKFLHVDRPPVGEEGPNDELNIRGLQGFDEEDLVTCRYTTPSGNSVTAIGFFTGQG
jgi:hypothetical protein